MKNPPKKQPQEAKEKPARSLPKLILIGVLVAVLAIGGGILGSLISNPDILEAFAQSKEEEEEQVRITVDLEEFLINLQPVGDENKYLKIELSLLTNSEENSTLIGENIAPIRDAVINVLRYKEQGTIFLEQEGKLAIKSEMISSINNVLGTEAVQEVYITNIVMQ